jgi:hypothetical protein
MIIQVRGLDVWGNQEDGYEVNDVYGVQAEIEVPADISYEGLIKALIDQEVLFDGEYEFDTFSYEDGEVYGNVVHKESGKPICELHSMEAK